MSLRVWLPLNGNLTNIGLNGGATISGTASFSSAGKIGDNYLNTANTISIYESSICDKKVLSFAFWAYITSSLVTSNWTLVARIQDKGPQSGSHLRFETCPPSFNDGKCCFSSYNNTNHAITSGYILSKPGGYYDQWVHFCFTSDGTTLTRYMNGEKIGTCAYDGPGYFAGYFDLANNDKCFKQDVRIYDHCLSPKEVKELSKALISHYPLSNYMELGISNKYNSSIAMGNLSPGTSGTFTKTALSNERGYKYKISYTGTGSNTWFGLFADNFSFTAGKRYYYSCKVRCNSSNFSMQLRAARSKNDWTTDKVTCVSISLADGKWHEYVVSQVVNSTYDRDGSTITSNPVLEFYTQNLSSQGTVYSADFDIKDVQVVESDYYLPFIDNVMSTSIVSDTSGFNNNGTKNGNLKWNSNSIRYSGCYDFTGNDYIKIPKPITISNSSYFTISMWVKPQTGCGNYSTILSNFDAPASGFWMAINTEESGTWFFNGSYARGNALLPIGKWSHIVMVFNAGTITWYTNGVPTSTGTVTNWATQFKDYLAIGNSYTGTTWDTDYVGSISDVRIYSTVLSSEDIEYLYSMSASLDKQGNLFAYEFKEE